MRKHELFTRTNTTVRNKRGATALKFTQVEVVDTGLAMASNADVLRGSSRVSS